MNTRYIAAEYRLVHWAQIMQARSESGLSIKGFCQNAGIHENTYFYWQRKLREAACNQLSVQPEPGQTSLVRTGFTEVKLYNEQKTAAHDVPLLHGNLYIEVSGVKITTDSTYPVNQLSQLLRELV
jgi:hypothetical protein